MSRDPIGYVDGINTFGYNASRPVDRVDPSGLLCQVSGSGIRYRVSVAALDAFVQNNSYSKLARKTRVVLQAQADRLPGTTTIPQLTTTGPQIVPNNHRVFKRKFAFFFFFVDWDICYDFKTDCELWLDEGGSTFVTDDGDGWVVEPGFRNITSDPFVAFDTRIPPLRLGEVVYGKKLIFADAPRGSASKRLVRPGWSGFKNTTKQTLEVRDRSRGGLVVSTVFHEVTIGVNAEGGLIASP